MVGVAEVVGQSKSLLRMQTRDRCRVGCRCGKARERRNRTCIPRLACTWLAAWLHCNTRVRCHAAVGIHDPTSLEHRRLCAHSTGSLVALRPRRRTISSCRHVTGYPLCISPSGSMYSCTCARVLLSQTCPRSLCTSAHCTQCDLRFHAHLQVGMYGLGSGSGSWFRFAVKAVGFTPWCAYVCGLHFAWLCHLEVSVPLMLDLMLDLMLHLLWLAVPCVQLGLTLLRPWAGHGLAMCWPWAGYELAMGWPWLHLAWPSLR